MKPTLIQRTVKGIKNYLNDFPSFQQRDKKNISTVIAPLQLQRIKQDLSTWREALTNEVENAWYPQRVALQRLYYDVILDGHVAACMEKRRNLTLLREYRFMSPDGKENEEMTRAIKATWFTDFLGLAVDAKLYGYSLGKIGDIENSVPSGIKPVKRHNVFLGRQGENPVVTTIPYMISGTPFLEGEYEPWTLWIPAPSDVGISDVGYGLLYKVSLYAIVMRKLLSQNTRYVELFGQPVRWAKTNKLQNDPDYATLINAMEQMGSSAYIITDPTDEIQLLEVGISPGANNPYENLEKRCCEMVSKILLGHANAIDSPPGRSLGSAGNNESPSQVALVEVQATDSMFVMPLVNNLLLPKLRKLGVKIPDGYIEPLNNTEDLENQKKVNDINKVFFDGLVQAKAAGFETDEETVFEATGIKVSKVATPMPEPGFSQEIKNKLERYFEIK